VLERPLHTWFSDGKAIRGLLLRRCCFCSAISKSNNTRRREESTAAAGVSISHDFAEKSQYYSNSLLRQHSRFFFTSNPISFKPQILTGKYPHCPEGPSPRTVSQFQRKKKRQINPVCTAMDFSRRNVKKSKACLRN
jgi:hypothetical protein